MYTALVSTHFKIPLACETWMRPKEPEYIPGVFLGYAYPTPLFTIMNTDGVSIPPINGITGAKWTITKDHSKWAVSLDPNVPVVCIGDINRQASQWKRGGGTLCMEDVDIFNLFDSIKVITHAPGMMNAEDDTSSINGDGSTQLSASAIEIIVGVACCVVLGIFAAVYVFRKRSNGRNERRLSTRALISDTVVNIELKGYICI